MNRRFVCWIVALLPLIWNFDAMCQVPADAVQIAGTVVDEATGEPIARATVRVAALRQNLAPPGAPTQFVTVRPMLQRGTDTDGRFGLDGFEPGQHDVIA